MLQVKKIPVFLLFVWPFCAMAQTEFPKEFIAHVRLSTGLISAPSAPELFVGSLQVIPQYTVIPYQLRGGLIAGGFYTARRVRGLFGPTISYKLADFKGGYFGSLGNLHLNVDHLWGTGHQRLLGGGLGLDLLNKIVVGLSVHRDYRLADWWLGSSIAFRLSAIKKVKENFPH